MKAICPISGVPFRTYDSIRLRVAQQHPIFLVDYHNLIKLLEEIAEQENDILENLEKNLENNENGAADIERIIKSHLVDSTLEAIHEKNYRNPIFRLYQTKHLVMLAFMKMAELLQNENGYIARPNPKIIDAYFKEAVELFMWAVCLSNPNARANLPKYKVSKINEDMGNLPDYLEILTETKNSIGSRYRSLADEKKLAAMEMGLAILSKHNDVLKVGPTDKRNPMAAKWALMTTRAPAHMYQFWYGILSSKSVNIIFDGVKVGDKVENVTAADLRELRDWLEDNLLGARGDVKNPHKDDGEHYFVARSLVLAIIRRHIAIVEQGNVFYKIVNAATGDNVLYATDDQLEKKALAVGLDAKPDLIGKSKIEIIRLMAAWRTQTKQTLIELQQLEQPESPQSTDIRKDKGSDYEIL